MDVKTLKTTIDVSSFDAERSEGTKPNPPQGFRKFILPALRERGRNLAFEKLTIQNN
jgi:hypothetical protein